MFALLYPRARCPKYVYLVNPTLQEINHYLFKTGLALLEKSWSTSVINGEAWDSMDSVWKSMMITIQGIRSDSS